MGNRCQIQILNRGDEPTVSTVVSNGNLFMLGEHVVSTWYDDDVNRLDWNLGIVDSVVDTCVSNMILTEKGAEKTISRRGRIILRNISPPSCRNF